MFKIPDLRGQFIRGWSNNGEIDKYRNFGSIQESSNKEHNHNASSSNAGRHSHTTGGAGKHDHDMDLDGNHSHWIDVSREYGCNRIWNSGCSSGNIQGSRNTSHYTHPKGNHKHKIHEVKDHTHSISTVNNHNHVITVSSNGDIESRPINTALLICIKY